MLKDVKFLVLEGSSKPISISANIPNREFKCKG